MKKVEYNKNLIEITKEYLKAFEILNIDDSTILLKKEQKKYIGFSWFLETRKDEVKIFNTKYWVHYIFLEEIIQPILFNNSLQGMEMIKGIRNSFNIKNDDSENISYDKGYLINEKTIINLKEKIKFILEFEALPFFEKWKDLTVLYEYIKGKERREELSEILGQFWQFKKAAILRLCNDSNYQEFIDQFVKRREEILELRPDSIDVQRYCQAAKELKEVLDKTAPIYNV
ncbi:hypothetical protein EDL99_06465 [Ornithobacterium rhinotracheale]|uniref:hypothetical protein n=1 Tax=Ornithobacterium rhinotracheale TaxID=28251 RepID=UPI00129CBA92|nr:hypothetical protein [Ornithobacterium rhinotracheale]MRJ08508.1 hypothetical protein [Ornithobacterium rhinotracheale]UOH76783.1 hypothetical protein MT996_06030 [Ornithobacterium rhinotracheale]